MRPISQIRTLVYYDGVQVFEGRDSIGGHHVGVLIDDSGVADRYLVAGVDPERLRQFRAGAIDLRTVFLEAGAGEWRLADVGDGFRAPVTPIRPEDPGGCRALLPDEGFVLHDGSVDDEALREARARGNVILELYAEPPEAADAHRIRATTLAGLLTHVQTLVAHAYRRAVELPRRALDGHLMNVAVPAAPGSFGVILEAAGAPDLLGYQGLARGLERMHSVFQCAADPNTAAERLLPHSGHLAGSWIALMRFLSECDTGLRYAWAAPELDGSRRGGVAGSLAKTLADELSKSSTLDIEKVDVTGKLDKVDVKSGAWRLATVDGPRAGKLRGTGPSLVGLVIGERYTFHCSEDIEVVHATGREKSTLYLESIDPA